MATIRFIAFLTVLSAISCTVEDESPEILSLRDKVTGEWRYSEIIMNNRLVVDADSVMEFAYGNAERWEINRRKFIYDEYGYYEVAYDRNGYYRLGTLLDSNWQPDIGSFILNETDTGNYIIHNPGLSFETTYEIQLVENESSLRRVSQRIMSADGPDWNATDTIPYEERFYKY